MRSPMEEKAHEIQCNNLKRRLVRPKGPAGFRGGISRSDRVKTSPLNKVEALILGLLCEEAQRVASLGYRWSDLRYALMEAGMLLKRSRIERALQRLLARGLVVERGVLGVKYSRRTGRGLVVVTYSLPTVESLVSEAARATGEGLLDQLFRHHALMLEVLRKSREDTVRRIQEIVFRAVSKGARGRSEEQKR